MDQRLLGLKNWGRAMDSYVFMLYEFILEIKPKNVLEIGTQYGQSTKTMLMALKENKVGKLVSIDHKSRYDILDADFPDVKDLWTFIKSSSHEPVALQKAKEALPEGELYDVLFLDGDHKMPGVGQDFNDYSTLVKPGGIILMHDVTNCNEDVKDFWPKITWEKFCLDWGKSRNHVIPGFGLVRKPQEVSNEKESDSSSS